MGSEDLSRPAAEQHRPTVMLSAAKAQPQLHTSSSLGTLGGLPVCPHYIYTVYCIWLGPQMVTPDLGEPSDTRVRGDTVRVRYEATRVHHPQHAGLQVRPQQMEFAFRHTVSLMSECQCTSIQYSTADCQAIPYTYCSPQHTHRKRHRRQQTTQKKGQKTRTDTSTVQVGPPGKMGRQHATSTTSPDPSPRYSYCTSTRTVLFSSLTDTRTRTSTWEQHGSNIAPRQPTLKSDSSGTITSVMYALGTTFSAIRRFSIIPI